MGGYQPTYIKAYETGLVQSREEFILPNDAYPTLENAFVWRERIKRKQGYELLGRLRRVLVTAPIGNYSTIIGTNTLSIFAGLGITVTQPNAAIEPGNITNISIVFAAPIGQTLSITTNTTTMTVIGVGPITTASINYATGVVTITASAAVGPAAVTFSGGYYPNLPVMGARARELNSISTQQTVFFDQVYAYRFSSGFVEFIPGTTWTGNDSDFFWSTNYWVGDGNLRIFWVTNFSGPAGDPIRYTNGVSWIDFAPTIDNAGNKLQQCLALLPFRGRLVAFNTLEGLTLAGSTAFNQRIRWAAIGNPFSDASAIVSTISANAWRDDIRGKGGFLDIPTSESITSVGYVRDNLVIYCERSTWQLRYTGNSIAPFQIEKVNTELGAASTFSAVQFDTSLVGIGDKGIVECDSYKSQRIDIKIPDLVFQFDQDNNGPKRVHGIRDFQQRLAFWTFPFKAGQQSDNHFPNRRLVYNYENDSWAIFTDSLTVLGTFQPGSGRTWQNTKIPWQDCNFPWSNRPAEFLSTVGGNQQGFIEYLDTKTTNDVSLFIQDITGNTTQPTVITSPNHNLQTGQVIKISGIVPPDPFTNLNNQIFGVVRGDLTGADGADKFQLWLYNSSSGDFTTPQLDNTGTYLGGGQIAIRDNFSILSKKFNFLDEGQNIQIGFIDILMDDTDAGAISLNIFLDYNDNSPVNDPPQNSSNDTFFNQIVETSNTNGIETTKNWKRIFCPVRGAFITIEWTLSNAQLIGVEQESDVQIDAQILWMRKAGRQLPVGV